MGINTSCFKRVLNSQRLPCQAHRLKVRLIKSLTYKKRITRKGRPFFFGAKMNFWVQFKIFTLMTLFSFGQIVAQETMPAEPSAVAYSKSAAVRGKSFYLINCQQCHDADGRALANIDFIAADLTAPGTWYYGTTPLHIFRSIKFGAGLEMPPFKDSLDDETIWQIVAHVLNIGPVEFRPTKE
jgi:mono/diheme cytochrome c family protein